MNRRTLDTIRLLDLSFQDIVKSLFEIFPFQRESFDILLSGIENVRPKGFYCNFRFGFDDPIYLELWVEGIGSFTKCYNDEFSPKSYQYSFESYELASNDMRNAEETEHLEKEETTQIEPVVLEFMLSSGRVVTDVPLLVNSFPGFAKYALSKVPF